MQAKPVIAGLLIFSASLGVLHWQAHRMGQALHRHAESARAGIRARPSPALNSEDLSRFMSAVDAIDHQATHRYLRTLFAVKENYRLLNLLALAELQRNWDRRDFNVWYQCYQDPSPDSTTYLQQWITQVLNSTPGAAGHKAIHAP